MKAVAGMLVLGLGLVAAHAEDEDDDHRQKVADFMGGVLGKTGAVTGRRTGITTDGTWVSYTGRGFVTSQGFYGLSRNQTWGKDGLMVKSGPRFYGARSVWKTGNSHTDADGNSVWVISR